MGIGLMDPIEGCCHGNGTELHTHPPDPETLNLTAPVIPAFLWAKIERGENTHTHTHTHQLRWSAGKQAFANSATQLCLRSVSERNLWANRFWRKSRSVLLKAFYSQKQHSCEQAAGSFLSKLLLFNPLKRFHKQPRHCQELWIALL